MMNETGEPLGALGSTIQKRVARGIGAQGFGQIVQALIRFAEVPLLLGFWGTDLYGEWLMLSAIPTYLSIGDGGFATTACREITMRSGAGDRRGALAVFQSTWLLLLAVSMAVGLLALGFVEAAPLKNWLGFSAMRDLEIKIVLLVLVAHVLVGFQGGLLNAGFWVTGSYPTSMTLQAITQLLEFGCFAFAVATGGGPVQAAIGYLAGRVVGTGLMWVWQRRVSPWLRHGFSWASFTELRRLTAPAFASLAFPLGNALNIQGLRLAVGLALGPSAVAVFTALRTLSRLAIQPKQIVSFLVEPELALAYGRVDENLFRRLFLESCQISIWVSIAASALVLIGSGIIIPYWTVGKIEMHWPLFVILLSTAFLNGTWHTALRVPLATNRHKKVALFFPFTYGILPLALASLFSKILGLSGSGLGLFIAELVTAIYMVKEALSLSRVSLPEWINSVRRPPFDLVIRAIRICRELIS